MQHKHLLDSLNLVWIDPAAFSDAVHTKGAALRAGTAGRAGRASALPFLALSYSFPHMNNNNNKIKINVERATRA